MGKGEGENRMRKGNREGAKGRKRGEWGRGEGMGDVYILFYPGGKEGEEGSVREKCKDKGG